jgi:hypothetical protein
MRAEAGSYLGFMAVLAVCHVIIQGGYRSGQTKVRISGAQARLF